MTAGWVAAWAAVATAIIYIGLGGFAVVQILQARRARELTYRPYIVVDFEFRRFLVYVSVRNIGQTPATNLTIQFDQPLKTVGLSRDLDIATLLAGPIPMIAPGRNIRVTFGVSHRILGDEKTPLRYEATVAYRGASPANRRYEENYVLDLAHFTHAAVDPEGLPELVGELKAVRNELQKWTVDGNGLMVFSTDRSRHVDRRDRHYWRDEARRVREEGGWPDYVRWVVNRQLERYGWR